MGMHLDAYSIDLLSSRLGPDYERDCRWRHCYDVLLAQTNETRDVHQLFRIVDVRDTVARLEYAGWTTFFRDQNGELAIKYVVSPDVNPATIEHVHALLLGIVRKNRGHITN